MAMKGRRGNALMLVLGIALLLGIQIYIVQTLTMGGFRHVEKVNAHMRSIYVGESAFSRVLARLKADRWENRWFKAAVAREFNEPVSGGTYSTVVRDVNPAVPNQKLVDVWIEARYEGSMSQMYYRVVYVDDTLDFTAQVYPRFFTFLEADQPNPFSGATDPAATLVQGWINTQELNEAAAIQALEGVKGTCNLTGAGGSLGIAFPGPVQDQFTVLAGGTQDLCAYTNAINTTIGTLPPPPAPPLPPPPPPTLPPPQNVIDQIRQAFSNLGPQYNLPINKLQPMTPTVTPYFDKPQTAEQEWQKAAFTHFDKGIGHIIDKHVPTFLEEMLIKRDAVPATTMATQIESVMQSVFNLFAAEVVRIGGTPPTVNPSPVSRSDYMNKFFTYRNWLWANGGPEYAKE